MRIVVSGATGFIGSALCRALHLSGHTVLALSRSATAGRQLKGHAEVIAWSSSTWRDEVRACDSVVNLAGESIASGRWTESRKRAILESRVDTTSRLVEEMNRSERPQLLVSASAVGYYGAQQDEALDETSDPGNDFLARVCVAWEREAMRAADRGARVVLLRIGVVLGEGGGALERMALPFKLYFGGPIGSGRQWVSWVHRDDVTGLIQLALEREDVRGPLNATSPSPTTMAELCRVLGRVLHRPSWAPVPAIALRLILGEMADMLLGGQRVLPRAAQQAGYAFRHPELEEALRRILR
jgi:uncharacterized protein (TIGR01777 family)